MELGGTKIEVAAVREDGRVLAGTVEATVLKRALPSARTGQVLRAWLPRHAGVIGAAALALELVAGGREP